MAVGETGKLAQWRKRELDLSLGATNLLKIIVHGKKLDLKSSFSSRYDFGKKTEINIMFRSVASWDSHIIVWRNCKTGFRTLQWDTR